MDLDQLPCAIGLSQARHPAVGIATPHLPSQTHARAVIRLNTFICLCTCPDTASADRIAGVLIEARLAACVNLLPGMQSVYRWQGGVERATEVLLLIKSSDTRRDAVVARIAELHPYDVPEIIVLDIAAGLPAYLQWIVDSTAEAPS